MNSKTKLIILILFFSVNLTFSQEIKLTLNLSKKLGSNQMKHIEIKNDGANIYKCNSCSQLWELSDPDYSYRGYFLKQNKNR